MEKAATSGFVLPGGYKTGSSSPPIKAARCIPAWLRRIVMVGAVVES
ncbi:hypothetical protein HC928_17520 [bacterium]|nr:hypothetical protein [bacterium]